MVYFIQAKNPSEAWFEAIKLILSSGKKVSGLKEIIHLLVEIENPLEINEKIHRAFCNISKLGQKSGSGWIKECIKYLSSVSEKWDKTYYARLVKYRNRVDQLDYIIKNLKKKPNSNQLFLYYF